jgi:hypothetical protein
LHPLRLPDAATPVLVAGLQDLAERRREPLVAEEEVDETRPGDLGPLDGGEAGSSLRDLLRRVPANRRATFVA